MTMLDSAELLNDLTDAQRQAVSHTDGPLLIIAAAGSGKTRVITRRVAYLMSLGVPGPSICAITFTNKAAGEMKQRVGQIVGHPMRDFGQLSQPWPVICTFHSLCVRILRHYAARIGVSPNFAIYDSADQTKLIKQALQLAELSASHFPAASVHAAISTAKNKLLGPEGFALEAKDFYSRNVAKVYRHYQKLLGQNNAMDFDDLMLRTIKAFREHPDVLAELQERFQYVLVDEYQDTNHAQYMLTHALASRHQNVCVVGDPDQSIYAWRGADISNILEFERDYPKAVVVKLEQNYRSTQTILRIADKLIKNNRKRKDKRLFSENAGGEKARLLMCQDEHQEAQAIAVALREMHEKRSVDWSDMAIFYRINALSRVIEEALRKASIPYVMARGVEFYNRKVIKDVLGYLRVIANPLDELSLERIINTPPRGIGAAGLKQLQAHATGHGMPLLDAMRKADQVAGMSVRAAKSTIAFAADLDRWRAMAGAAMPGAATAGAAMHGAAMGGVPMNGVPTAGTATDSDPSQRDPSQRRTHVPVRTLMEDVVRRSGLEAALIKAAKRDRDSEGDDPMANVNELITSATEFDAEAPEGTLEDYLSKVSLVSDLDHLKQTGGAVMMMTLHAAKGLEFPVVVMIGMEDGCLPHSRARDDAQQLEEERRLCFVGITRAREQLILSCAHYRTVRGLRERTIASAFLKEMPPGDIETIELGIGGGRASRPASTSPSTAFRIGQRVMHPQFGAGHIVAISGPEETAIGLIHFDRAGDKTLVFAYARLTPLD